MGIGVIEKVSVDKEIYLFYKNLGLEKEKIAEIECKAEKYAFDNDMFRKEAGEYLKTFIQKGDLVLIKGSQGMRMERTVEAILLNKENKNKLLVRQEPEWLAKE